MVLETNYNPIGGRRTRHFSSPLGSCQEASNYHNSLWTILAIVTLPCVAAFISPATQSYSTPSLDSVRSAHLFFDRRRHQPAIHKRSFAATNNAVLTHKDDDKNTSTKQDTTTADIDSLFEEAKSYEKLGLFRSEYEAFVKLAKLLERKQQLKDFSLEKRDAMVLLAYVYFRLGFLHLDALGEPRMAVRYYEMAMELDPAHPSSLQFLATALEASIEGNDEIATLDRVKEIYSRALVQSQKNCPSRKLQFMYAITMERLGDSLDAETFHNRPISNRQDLLESWQYILQQTQQKNSNLTSNLARGTRSMIQIALDAAQPLIQERKGLVCEFGVATGRSIRMTREIVDPSVAIHGFDTFHGLPEAWGDEPIGSYSCQGRVPSNMSENTYFHKGLFSDTVDPFLESQPADSVLAYANIDCDLYSSTMDVLISFADRIVVGTVLIFDEYIAYPSWKEDEYRAWQECCGKYGWEYDYLAFSLATKQAIVKVTKVP